MANSGNGGKLLLMAGNGSKLGGTSYHGWERLEWPDMAVKCRKLFEMARTSCKWEQLLEIADNGWKWLKLAENSWKKGEKMVEMAGNGWKQMKMAIIMLENQIGWPYHIFDCVLSLHLIMGIYLP